MTTKLKSPKKAADTTATVTTSVALPATSSPTATIYAIGVEIECHPDTTYTVAVPESTVVDGAIVTAPIDLHFRLPSTVKEKTIVRIAKTRQWLGYDGEKLSGVIYASKKHPGSSLFLGLKPAKGKKAAHWELLAYTVADGYSLHVEVV